MARNRLELHDMLLHVYDGSLVIPHVYFQPEENVQMVYPCIIYQRQDTRNQYADNLPYASAKRYQVTVIDEDPDSEFPDRVALLPYTTHDRFYVAENLNHDVYVVYF